MTDSKLLEQAAKAAGNIPLPLCWVRPFDDELTPINNRGKPWSPLTDDGDALRLAINLCMDLHIFPGRCFAYCPKPGGVGDFYADVKNADTTAATRRAITFAAAKMGKAMP